MVVNQSMGIYWSVMMADDQKRSSDEQVGGAMVEVGGQQTPPPPGRAEWANLLPELLLLISGKLSNICDYVRFRSICSSWRTAVGPGDHIHPFLLWKISLNRNRNNIIYYNIADYRSYHIDLPEEAQGKWIYGSNYGWLVVIDPPHIQPPTVSLLNPITKAQIQLPALPDDCLKLSTCTNFILCSHPLYPPPPPAQPLVAAWNDVDDTSVIFSQGDNNWTLFDAPDIIHYCTYFDGALYYVHHDGRLSVLDIATSSLRQLINPRPPEVATDYPLYFYMDEFAGDLWLFPRYYEVTDEHINMVALTYKLDISGKEGWKWVPVNGNTFTSRMTIIDQTGMADQYKGALLSIDPEQEMIDGITTKKYHHCQIMGNRTVLLPSLH